MPIVQSAYTRYMPVAQVGMPASMHGWDIDTKIVETVAGIGFGLVVSKGSADNGIIIGGAAAVGVTVRDIALSQVPGNLAADLYARYANAGIMVVGDIWAIALNGCDRQHRRPVRPGDGRPRQDRRDRARRCHLDDDCLRRWSRHRSPEQVGPRS
jgi:hypothetical protein